MSNLNTKKCIVCKSNLPVTHFMSDDMNRLSPSCRICTQMKKYKKENTKWCEKCRMYYDKNTNHIHSNIFALSRFDFKGAHDRKLKYAEMTGKRVENDHAECLKRAKNIDDFKDVKIEHLVSDGETSNMINSGIKDARLYLLNVNYFRHENEREKNLVN